MLKTPSRCVRSMPWEACTPGPMSAPRASMPVRQAAPTSVTVAGVSYDIGTSSAAYSVPRLTTIRQDTAQLAERGVQTLLRGIHYAQPPIHEAVPFTLLQRESVRVLGPAP